MKEKNAAKNNKTINLKAPSNNKHERKTIFIINVENSQNKRRKSKKNCDSHGKINNLCLDIQGSDRIVFCCLFFV